MIAKFPVKTSPIFSPLPFSQHKFVFKVVCCEKNASSSSNSSDNRFDFKLVGQSLPEMKWKFSDIDANAMQESVNQWLSKTQSFFNEVASPLVKSVQDRRPNHQDYGQDASVNQWLSKIQSFSNEVTSPLVKKVQDRRPTHQDDGQDVEDMLITEQTVDSRTPGGNLSEAAIISIEQFSRMNGLTGKKMQKIFKALVPQSVYDDPRNLLEYCCFRFLSRNTAEVHPGLKEPAFQRLIFITMLAWENPYSKKKDNQAKLLGKNTFQFKTELVGEEAFVRIGPAVSGVADCPTAHNLFKALAGDKGGISFSIWLTYINELLK